MNKVCYSLKQLSKPNLRFESYVISYRSKTVVRIIYCHVMFESYVISYRSKTRETNAKY